MQDNNFKTEKTKRGRILFINPPLCNLESLYLSAIAEEKGFEANVCESDNYKEIINDITIYSPNFLVAKITFDKFRLQLEALAEFKERLPLCKLIVYGEPFLTYNHNVTYENPYIDYVMFGECEETFSELLDGAPDNEILGICYTDDNMQSVKNEQRPFIENLDHLIKPARHLIKDNSSVQIEVSRGCPYHCIFCLATVKNGVVHRTRSPKSVVKEILYCVENYGSRIFDFKSDNFNFDKNWIKRFCKLILKCKLKISWSCDLVPKNLDEELVKLLKASGCKKCRIGVESGSDLILEKIDKDIKLQDIKESFRLLKKYKIKTTAYYIIGLPWETEESAKDTIEFALSLPSDYAVFNIATPLPGTKLFVYSMLNKLFIGQPEFSKEEKLPLCKTHTLSRERVLELKKEAEKRFYNRPKMFFKKIINFCNKNNNV